MINNFGAATGFGSTGSTTNGHPTTNHRGHGFPAASSPGPTLELYNSSQDTYVSATSPQPASAFPPIVSRVRLFLIKFILNY